MAQYGFQHTANPGRQLSINIEGKTYERYPVATPWIQIGTELNDVIEQYAKDAFQKGDILCIASKLVSVCNKLVVHRSEVKVTWLAKFIVKFVTKWPNDVGYDNPPKMQVAIDRVGYPRMILAIVVGGVLKLLGKRGYFYKIAGHQINAIDGFIPHATPPFNEYAFLPPTAEYCEQLAKRIENRFGVGVAILDGNNIENHVFGMSPAVKTKFSKERLKEILSGNPQGQDDDGVITPMLIIREK